MRRGCSNKVRLRPCSERCDADLLCSLGTLRGYSHCGCLRMGVLDRSVLCLSGSNGLKLPGQLSRAMSTVNSRFSAVLHRVMDSCSWDDGRSNGFRSRKDSQ